MPINYFKNTSISKKLYFTIGIMAFLIIIELCVLSFALSTLSAIRGYVAGEGLWSKSQRDASLHLRLYAYSGKEAEYQSFLKYLKVPLGDRKERIALEKSVPDLEMARKGLLQGRNHPDDIDGMIRLLQRFSNTPHLARTIYFWKKAETSLMKFIPVGQQLHAASQKGTLTNAQTQAFIAQIDQINQEITPSEDGFSYTLGEGSRWLERIVLRILIGIALTVEVTGIIIAVSISRNIQKGLGAIIEVAQQLARGELNRRVGLQSKDEIGTLATAFNTMADHLEDTIAECKDSAYKLRSFFDSTRACHVLLDSSLNMIYFNQASVELARKHYHLELTKGITAEQWVHPDRLPGFVANCEIAMSGHMIQEEVPITYVAGETIWWSLTFEGARNEYGEVVGVSYHAIDITRRIEQEQEIKAQNQSLRQIAHIQSHGMRRPVASILGLINVFELQGFKATKEELIMLREVTVELDEQIRAIVHATD